MQALCQLELIAKLQPYVHDFAAYTLRAHFFQAGSATVISTMQFFLKELMP
jgi:hypothetical protein